MRKICNVKKGSDRKFIGEHLKIQLGLDLATDLIGKTVIAKLHSEPFSTPFTI